MKKNCAICDAEFEGHHSSLCCSDKCRRQRKHQKDAEYRAKHKEYIREYKKKFRRGVTIISKTCVVCESSFQTTSKRHNQDTCSEECNRIKINTRQQKRRVKIASERPKKYGVCKGCNNTMVIPHNVHTKHFCSPVCKSGQPFNLLRRRMYTAVRRVLCNKGLVRENHTFSLLGYTGKDLYGHIESQFTDGMSWDNMGEWHIDHIRPVSSFDFDSTDHPDFKKCWALNNLQPLWAFDNMSKRDKWDGIINA